MPVGASNSLWASHCSRFTDESSPVKRIFWWRLDGGGWFIPTIITLEAEITMIIAKTPKTGVTGKPFNIASYALLTMMVAQVCDLEPGDFVHTLGDAHIYCNHFDQVHTQLARTAKALPVMKINPSVKDIFAFTFDDFTLDGYEAEPSISAPIAV